MKNIFLLAVLAFFNAITQAQTPINLGQSIVINSDSQYGFNRPRVVLTNNDIPLVIWGRSGGNSAAFCSKLENGSFSLPIKLSPDSMQVRSGWYDGPNVASKGDTVYVVWHNMSADHEHIYLVRSFDGGDTFSDPIQTDTITGDAHLEYPGVTVDVSGNPVIFFIKSNSNWSVPRQVIYASTDYGDTFPTEVIATEFSPGLPCECCQATMDISDNNWVYMYRNNVSDIRNTYFAVSDNDGNTFENSYEMDAQDWFIQSCPSTGPEGYITGDNIIGAWMSSGYASTGKIVFGSVNMVSPAENSGSLLEPSLAANVTQNYPAAAGGSDFGAIAWQDNRFGLNQTFIAFTDDQGQSYGESYLVSDTTLVGSADAIHLAYSSGTFHLVWKTLMGTYYRTASIATSTDYLKLSSSIPVYPNPARSKVRVSRQFADWVTISNTIGLSNKAQVGLDGFIDVSHLPNGVYFVQTTKETKKFVISR